MRFGDQEIDETVRVGAWVIKRGGGEDGGTRREEDHTQDRQGEQADRDT